MERDDFVSYVNRHLTPGRRISISMLETWRRPGLLLPPYSELDLPIALSLLRVEELARSEAEKAACKEHNL